MEAAFRKDLGHLTWDEVLRRQMQRAHLIPDWLDALAMGSGMRVLDVGAGPGYVSQQVAGGIGPTGLVLALDRASEAIAYLERLRDKQGMVQIRPILADADRVNLKDEAVDAALVTIR